MIEIQIIEGGQKDVPTLKKIKKIKKSKINKIMCEQIIVT